MVIDKLLNATAAKFIGGSAAAALTTAFGGRYFRESAVGSPAFPYVVSEVVPSAPLTDAYGNATSADVTIIFKVVGNGHNATAANMATLVGVFDDTLLTMTGGTNFSMYRVGEPVPTALVDDESGDDVWQWAVAYTFSVQ